MPVYELNEGDFENDQIDIISILVKSGLVTTRSEGRRAVEQGGVAVDGEKCGDYRAVFSKNDLCGDGKVFRRGKKNFRKVLVK